MAVIKCKMCGGDLIITDGITVAECEYCGTKQTVPLIDNEKKISLFRRANWLFHACEFDKAAGVYESIISFFPDEAEAYWGLVLCKYGIEYIDDLSRTRKVPTCHRSSFDSVLDDENLEQALEKADIIARKIYREEAKVIEELRKNIIEVSVKEEPYDVFICYKEKDETGQRTQDSVIAQEVYDILTEKGYRVFFSRITLEDKLGQEYEPYIFAALNSAPIMLVFGTDYDYFNAVWVKNEWRRFLALIELGQKKTLIACFKEIDADDMPKEFRNLQALDMGKVGAIQDLVRGIYSIIGERQELLISNVSTDGYLELGFQKLEIGDNEEAANLFQDAVKLVPNYSIPYLGLWVSADEEAEKDIYYRKYKILFCEEDAKLETQYIQQAKKSIYKFLTSFILCKDSFMLSKGLTINSNIDVNKEFEIEKDKKTTLLCLAAKMESIEIISQILDAGADINCMCNKGRDCALEIACRKKNDNLVEFLIQRGAEINKRLNYKNEEWITPFVSCIYNDYVNGIEFFLKQGASANAIYGVKNYRVLGLALQLGRQKICTLLINYGADINALSGGYPCFVESFLSSEYKYMIKYTQAHNAEFQTVWFIKGEVYDIVRLCLEKKILNRIALAKDNEGMKVSIKRNYDRWKELEEKCSSMEFKITSGCIIILFFLVLFIWFEVVIPEFINDTDFGIFALIIVSINFLIAAFWGGIFISSQITSVLDVTAERIAHTKYNMFYGSIIDIKDKIGKLL